MSKQEKKLLTGQNNKNDLWYLKYIQYKNASYINVSQQNIFQIF